MEKIKEWFNKNKKIFILDTSVLLHSSEALEVFSDNVVIIPDGVLHELDKHKIDNNDVGLNAREVGRKLDELRLSGDLTKGVEMDNGGLIVTLLNFYDKSIDMPYSWDKSVDYQILKLSKYLTNEFKERVILVTNDTFMRIKASTISVISEEFINLSSPSLVDQYKGRRILFASDEIISQLYLKKYYKLNDESDELFDENHHKMSSQNLYDNEYLLIKSNFSNSSVLAIYNNNSIIKVKNNYVYHLKPKTAGQTFALNALMDDWKQTPLTIIKGPAGTGKTLLSIAVGLDAVENNKYNKVLYLRSNTTLDEEIGFLPGTEEEKLDWMLRPVKDNLEKIYEDKFKNTMELNQKINSLFERKIIQVEFVGFMRGRSLNNTFVIIDEAQNLTPKQIKTLLSRAGEGTKIVLLGDPEQIDKPFLNISNNGLSYAGEKLKGSYLVKQVTLLHSEGERSDLSVEVLSKLD